MKKLTAFLISCWLLQACNNTANTKPKIDTHSSSDVSSTERGRQIDRAKNNRTLLPGNWTLTDIRSGDESMQKIPLTETDFDELRFPSADSFAVGYNKKIVGSGTMEWMAEDRELVLTSVNDDRIRRILIKNINTQMLKIKFNGSYLTFKKME